MLRPPVTGCAAQIARRRVETIYSEDAALSASALSASGLLVSLLASPGAVLGAGLGASPGVSEAMSEVRRLRAQRLAKAAQLQRLVDSDDSP